MTTAKTFERLLTKSPELASATGASEQLVRKILKMAEKDIINRRRQPAPLPPAGSISQSEGARKYFVSQGLISRWVSAGYIPVILRTNKEVYIDESKLAEIAKVFLKKPGRGRRTVQKKFKTQTT